MDSQAGQNVTAQQMLLCSFCKNKLALYNGLVLIILSLCLQRSRNESSKQLQMNMQQKTTRQERNESSWLDTYWAFNLIQLGIWSRSNFLFYPQRFGKFVIRSDQNTEYGTTFDSIYNFIEAPVFEQPCLLKIKTVFLNKKK